MGKAAKGKRDRKLRELATAPAGLMPIPPDVFCEYRPTLELASADVIALLEIAERSDSLRFYRLISKYTEPAAREIEAEIRGEFADAEPGTAAAPGKPEATEPGTN